MRPFASSLRRAGRSRGLAVWTVQYRYRGWNGADRSPVVDTQWALDEVRRRHGDVPVVLVGHSMGGRTALQAAGDVSVRGVCALAPWVERGDPVEQTAGRALLVAHGTWDTVTSASASRRYAEQAAAVTSPVGRLVVEGDLHAMVFRWRRWHRIATGFALGTLQLAPMPHRIERAFAAGADGNFRVRT
jgi:dienelactone hydrolase